MVRVRLLAIYQNHLFNSFHVKWPLWLQIIIIFFTKPACLTKQYNTTRSSQVNVNTRQIISSQTSSTQCQIVYCSVRLNAIQCNKVQFNAIQCNSIEFHAIQCKSMQFNAIQHVSMQFHAIPLNLMQFNAIQCNLMQFKTIQCKSIQVNAA